MNPIPVKKRRPLVHFIQGTTALVRVTGRVTVMDAEDLHFLDGWTVSLLDSGGGYVQILGSITEKPRYRALLHRLILNAPRDKEVDHINGDSLDNRKANLRICDHAENLRNVKPRCNRKSSRYKGVQLDKACPYRPWRAQVTCNGKKYHVGHFATEELAAEAYNQKSEELFGVFARVNDIASGEL
ncbi:MAG: HNH endonuclease [Kiritimatiellae bacterium]|nr:HNH endonuclease [Kiritimatiellia bacterium]